MRAFDRALGCISSVKCERNKKPQGNDCKPPCQKLWEIFLSSTFPNLTLLFLNLLHYKTQHMCKLLSYCLMKHSFLLPVRQFLQTEVYTLVWLLEPSSELERLQWSQARDDNSIISAPHLVALLNYLRLTKWKLRSDSTSSAPRRAMRS